MLRVMKYSACMLAATLVYVAPAHAQASRTWVSGVGDDANPCSRTAPCKTFGGAISKTLAGGEINCLDPGGFGAVTITKSISIVCDETLGSVLVSGTNGIIINDSTGTAQVTLSGIDFEGLGFSPTTPGSRGIWFVSGASLIVRNSTIRGFRSSTSTGIAFTPSGAAMLMVENVTLSGNGNTNVGGAIRIQPTGTGSARVSLVNVRMTNNTNSGITVDATGNTGAGISLSLENVQISGAGSGVGVALSAPTGTTTVGAMINNSTIVNGSVGIVANGPGLTGRIGNSTITGNATGVLIVGGATLSSYNNNRLDGNPSAGTPNNGAFSGTIGPH